MDTHEQQPAPTESVVQTIIKVMGDVRKVAKTGENTQQHYKFRGIDAVMNAVGPQFRAHGLVVLPNVISKEVEHGTTSKGGHMVAVRLRVEYTFINQYGDTLKSIVESEANDTSDKATAKAMSVAYRTVLLQVLALPTDDIDPDAEFIERGANQPARQPGPPLPDDWQVYVDQAFEQLNLERLANMEQDALAAGDAKARTYIATKRLEAKKMMRDQITQQEQQGTTPAATTPQGA